jgi:cytoskeletal protein CcmA (bactofilin family)
MIAVAVVASPAGAVPDGPLQNDRRISLSGGVLVAEGDVVHGPVVSIDGPVRVEGTVDDDVLVGNGRLVVNGHVTGDLLVVHGDVIITGRVGGSVLALDGRITVREDALVRGDVVSRRQPDVARGTVRGDVKKLDVGSIFTAFLIAFLAYLWIAVTISVGLLGLLFVWLFPRAADTTASAGRRFWPTLGWGALVGILGPILGVVVLATIVGLPFGLGVFSALTVLAPLGYVTSSLILGRLMVKGSSMGRRIGAFFAGFGILRAVALLPGIGFVVWLLVCIYGLGALARAAWRAGRYPLEPLAAPPPEPPPTVDDEPTVDDTAAVAASPASPSPARTEGTTAPTE